MALRPLVDVNAMIDFSAGLQIVPTTICPPRGNFELDRSAIKIAWLRPSTPAHRDVPRAADAMPTHAPSAIPTRCAHESGASTRRAVAVFTPSLVLGRLLHRLCIPATGLLIACTAEPRAPQQLVGSQHDGATRTVSGRGGGGGGGGGGRRWSRRHGWTAQRHRVGTTAVARHVPPAAQQLQCAVWMYSYGYLMDARTRAVWAHTTEGETVLQHAVDRKAATSFRLVRPHLNHVPRVVPTSKGTCLALAVLCVGEAVVQEPGDL